MQTSDFYSHFYPIVCCDELDRSSLREKLPDMGIHSYMLTSTYHAGETPFLDCARHGVRLAYEEGKYPVIILGEELGTERGADIMVRILEECPQGGIFLIAFPKSDGALVCWEEYRSTHQTRWRVDNLWHIFSVEQLSEYASSYPFESSIEHKHR